MGVEFHPPKMSLLGKSRPEWSSNFVYILAAVGCAAGLGNLWRFSMLAYEHGGGAFIFALLLSNILMVFPLIMMETVVGQKFRMSGPHTFEKIKKGTSWIQWIPVFALIGILFYYVPIFGWGAKYLVSSLNGAFLNNPSEFFTSEILHLTGGVTETGELQLPLLIGVLIAYAFSLFALRKNVLSLGPVVKITATAPFVLLAILIVRGVTLPGAEEGLRALFIPDWAALWDVKLWQAAVSQSFFSANLAFGYYMIAGSHRAEKAEVAKTSLWVLGGNFVVSVLCGLAVFSTLGFMAAQQGVPVSEAATGGPMLVFSVLPTAVSMMPWGVIAFAVMLFLVVITLAIDSIFGILEIIAGGLHDFWHKTKYWRIVVCLCVIGVLGALPYLTGAGLYFLDITDHYIGGFIFLIMGLLETLVLGYVIGANKIRKWINHTSKGLNIGKWFNVVLYATPFILGFLVSVTLYQETQEIYGGYPIEYIIGFGFVPLGLVLILSIIFGIKTTHMFKRHGVHLPNLKK